MTTLKLSVSDEGIRELIEFAKVYPTLNLNISIQDKVIVVQYDKNEVLKIKSGPGKL